MTYKRVIKAAHKHIDKYYAAIGRSRREHTDSHNVVTVSATVTPEFIHVLPDLKGTMHQHFYISINEVLEGDKKLIDNNTVFVAVHYGDEDGLKDPVPNLQPGRPIVIKGKFVPTSQAYRSDDNPGYPVLHYTHHPIGYIVYEGTTYE